MIAICRAGSWNRPAFGASCNTLVVSIDKIALGTKLRETGRTLP
jgi:hypothetical protein